MNTNKNEAACQTVVLFSVYVLRCRVTNQYYVGVTKGKVSRRIGQHKRGNQFVDKEIQRIGWENFEWWVVEESVPAELISEREQYWVGVFNSVYPNGFNKTRGGISNITMSDDTREILRQKALERDMSGENNPHYGKKQTDESKEAIRQSRLGKPAWNKGIPCSEEQKAKLREKALERDMSGENNPFYGKHHTEESNEKNRQAHLDKPSWNKGVPCSEEAKAKLRAKALERNVSGENNPFYGKHHTPEAIERSRQANLGRPAHNKGVSPDDEARIKMSASALARVAKKAAEVAEVAKAAAEAAKGTDAAEALQAAAEAAVAKAAEAQSKAQAAQAVVDTLEATAAIAAEATAKAVKAVVAAIEAARAAKEAKRTVKAAAVAKAAEAKAEAAKAVVEAIEAAKKAANQSATP